MKLLLACVALLAVGGRADGTGPEIHGVVSKQGIWEYRFARTDDHGHEYQWRHYYDEKTGKPVDARVPVGWSWDRFALGAKHFDCPAEWNGEKLNICHGQNVAGEPRCCIRGAEKAAKFCQSAEGSWCLSVNFMEENPASVVFNAEVYEPGCKDTDCTEWQNSDKLFRYTILGSQDAGLLDDGDMSFYSAIEEPVYVLMGIDLDSADVAMHGTRRSWSPEGCDWEKGECTSDHTRDPTDFVKFWNTATPPTKCGDGSLKDCNGECFNDCKVYGLPGSEVWGYAGCSELVGDYVCDWGQRIMSNGKKGPKLDCPLWNVDNGDCDCASDRTMTCSGYCLADADCESQPAGEGTHTDVDGPWGKKTCLDWIQDDVCDYGQRISDAGITMHFECERWNYDNEACGAFDPASTECPWSVDAASGATGASGAAMGDEAGCPNPDAQGDRPLTDDGRQKIWAFKDMKDTPAPTVAPHYKAPAGNSAVILQDIDVLKNQVKDLEHQIMNIPKYQFPEGEVRAAPSFADGDRVWVNYYHSGYSYPATLLEKSATGYSVSYDDGDVQTDVHKDEIFVLPPMEDGWGAWKLKDDRTAWEWGTIGGKRSDSAGGWEYQVDMPARSAWVPRDFDWLRWDYKFETGDRVWAEKGGNLKWQKGTITDAKEHGKSWRYEVTYDSGDSETGVISAYLYFIHPQRVLSTNVEEEEVCSAITMC